MKYPYKKVCFENGNGILMNSIRDIKKHINTTMINKNEYMIHMIFQQKIQSS